MERKILTAATNFLPLTTGRIEAQGLPIFLYGVSNLHNNMVAIDRNGDPISEEQIGALVDNEFELEKVERELYDKK